MPRTPLDADRAIKAFAVLQAIDGVNDLRLSLDVQTYDQLDPGRKKGDRLFTLSIRSKATADLIGTIRAEMNALGLTVGFDGDGLTVE